MEEFKPAIFRLGEELYGIDISKVSGVENVDNIVRIPSAANYIKGIINLRGSVIPVYSLKRKFNIKDDSTTENSQYIITYSSGSVIALEVDGVDEIKNIEKDMIHPVPRIVVNEATKYMQSIINVDKKMILILDVDNLLTENEKQAIDSMVNDLNNK